MLRLQVYKNLKMQILHEVNIAGYFIGGSMYVFSTNDLLVIMGGVEGQMGHRTNQTGLYVHSYFGPPHQRQQPVF